MALPTVEVWADVACPFAHVGLRLVAAQFERSPEPVRCRVRAWPLEWVNGAPMQGPATADKVEALRHQLDGRWFAHFDPDAFPATTIPALDLVAAAYRRDEATGWTLSLAVRSALFEEGRDIADDAVLDDLASRHGLERPTVSPDADVTADYEEGHRRSVTGSPHFFVADEQFFCPSLDLGRDATGHLVVDIRRDFLDGFVSHLAELAARRG